MAVIFAGGASVLRSINRFGLTPPARHAPSIG